METREGLQGQYGAGRKMRMQFGAFLRRMAARDDALYLTTQEVCTLTLGDARPL